MPNDTAPGWDGVPMSPEKDGWHWLQSKSRGFQEPVAWFPEKHDWLLAGLREHTPPSIIGDAWLYLGHCLTPSAQSAREAAAVAAGAREMRQAVIAWLIEQAAAAANVAIDYERSAEHRRRAETQEAVLTSARWQIRTLPIDTTALDRLLAEAREAGYRAGWNDRESDILERAARIGTGSTPA